MPLFTILRHVGPESSRDDVDAAALRAIVCASEFSGLRWVQSYWDAERGDIRCVYEAQGEAQLREHARRSRIPCDEVREVVAVGPGDYVDMGALSVSAS